MSCGIDVRAFVSENKVLSTIIVILLEVTMMRGKNNIKVLSNVTLLIDKEKSYNFCLWNFDV